MREEKNIFKIYIEILLDAEIVFAVIYLYDLFI